MTAKKISVAQAAKTMGVAPQFVRIGLQRGLLPFGFAVNISGGSRYTYYINPRQFAEYLGLPATDTDKEEFQTAKHRT